MLKMFKFLLKFVTRLLMFFFYSDQCRLICIFKTKFSFKKRQKSTICKTVFTGFKCQIQMENIQILPEKILINIFWYFWTVWKGRVGNGENVCEQWKFKGSGILNAITAELLRLSLWGHITVYDIICRHMTFNFFY